ncbi:MAG TPA: cytochrome P450 [Pseudonocardia sp.]|jgi:cytochrome P450
MTPLNDTVNDSLIGTYNPLLPEIQHDPYPYYRAFRDAGIGIHHQLMPDTAAATRADNHLVAGTTTEFWSVFGYSDVLRIVQDPSTFRSGQGPGPERALAPNGVGALVWADPPAHRIQRSLSNKAFSPRRVTALESRIREIANEFIDRFAGTGTADLQADYADRVPGTINTELLGISTADQEKYHDWVLAWVDALAGDEAAQQRALVASLDFFNYFTEIIGGRRKALDEGKELPDDLLTALITAEVEGESYDDLTLMLILQVLITGGEETTSGGIGGGLMLLCNHPEQFELLRRDRSLLPNAVEEILRYISPVQAMFRNTSAPTTIAGVEIPADSKVRLVYGAANRDPALFPDPDRFDITRDLRELRGHIAFGGGIHACLGASMARRMLSIALDTVLDRLPGLRVADPAGVTRGDNLTVRRLKNLPMCWDAR